MKKYLTIFLFLSFWDQTSYSQNTLQASNDLGRIALTPIIVSRANIPSYAATIVKNKLTQVITQNGLGGVSYDQRFIITANIVETSREITNTAPPMFALELSTTLYVGDIVTGNLYSSCLLPVVNGVGTNEAKAYMSAIRAINMQKPEVNDIITKGKEKIIEYYNSQIDFIIANAMALAKKEEYDNAMSALFTVPNVCKDAYLKAMNAVTEIYQNKIDNEGNVLLNTAKQVWNSEQSYSGATKAVAYLSKVHPLSSSFTGACELSETIAKHIKEIDKRDWDFKMKQYEDEQKILNKEIDNAHSEKILLINASKEIGVARSNQPTTYNYNHITWW